jgi:hypothetical protein
MCGGGVNARRGYAAIGAKLNYHIPFGEREPLSGRLLGGAGRATRSLVGGGGADASAVALAMPIIA